VFQLLHLSRHHVIALVALAALSSCGGGGGGEASQPVASSPASAPAPAPPTRVVAQSDLEIAQSIFSGTSRTPQGFYADPAPSGHAYVSTTHLKNTDVEASVAAPAAQYELCTNDWNQALSWSETGAHNAPEYSNLVETNDDPRFFEFGRVKSGQPEVFQRTRIFKCAYLDRAAANLRVNAGAAGRLNKRPMTGDDLRIMAEYLWQFTTFNNFGNVVLKSSGEASASAITHTLIIAKLVRSGISASCDRVDVLAWRHSADTTTGQVQLDAQTLWSFGTRESSGVAQLCS
jgi:hypothetical protein